MNPLAGLVQSQFENRGLVLAAVFFILQFALLAIVRVSLGSALGSGFGLIIVRELVSWILLSIAIYILLRAFKGASAKGRFTSVMASYSVVYLVIFVAALLFTLLNYVVLGQGFLQSFSSIGPDSLENLPEMVASSQLPAEGTLTIYLALSLLIGVAALLLTIYVVYAIGQSAKKTSSFSNLIFAVVFMAISILINSNLLEAFQPIMASIT